MKIQQIRQQYPQYKDLGDAQLAELLRRKFYPGLTAEDFNQRIGLAPAAPSTERTWAETATDIGAGLTTGAGRLAQLPGQLYGLATGDFSPTGTLGVGKRIEAAGQGMKSEGLKAREAQRSAAVQAAAETGQVEAFKTAFMETIKDPALAASFVAEQLPNLAAIIATGGTAAAVTAGRVSAAALAKGASQKAAARLAAQAATRVGAPAAVGAGAVMQGADIGAGTYDAVVERLKSQGMPQEQAAEEAINSARAAGASAATISFLVNRYFPGGMALERALLGKKTGLGMLGGAATGALREIPTEVIEETAGGRLLQNIALQGVDPTQSLAEGLGEAGGMAAAGALLVGGGAGAIAGRGPRKEPGLSPEAAADMEAQRRIEAEREAARAARSAQATADEALLASSDYAELVRGREVLRQTPDTPGAKELLKALDQRIQEVLAGDVAQQQAAAAQTARDAQLASQSAFAATEPQQMEMGGMGEPGVLPPAVSSEAQAWARTPAGQDFLGTLRQLPADTIEASRGDTRLLPRAKDKASAAKRELFSALYPQAPAAPTPKQMEAAGQRALPLTITPEGQPTTERPPVSPQREFGGFGMAGTLPQPPVAPEPTPPTQKQLEAAGQRRLPLRDRKPTGQPTTSLVQEPIVEPTAPAAPVEDGIPEPTVRQKPVVPIPEALEATGTDAAKAWARKPYGQKFIAKIQQIDPNSIEDARGALAKGSDPASTAKREIFNAIYPDSVAAPAVRDDIRPEQAVVGEPAEPSVGVPVPSGPDQAGAQLAEPSDGAGVGAVPGTAGAEPVVEGAAPAAVTAEQLIQNVEYAKSKEDYYAALVALAEARNTDPVVDAYIEREYGDTNTPTPAQQAFRKEYNQAPAKVAEARRGTAYGIEPEEVTQPYTAGELRSEVSDFVRAPVPEHKLKVVDSVEELLGSRDANEVEVGRALQREGAFGVASNGRAYLVANRIQKGQGRAKFMHEVGAHLGLEGLLPTSLYKRLTNQLKQWAESGANTDEVGLAKRAMQRVQAAQTPDADRDAELLAYFVEEAVQAGVDPTATQGGGPLRQWFRALWAAFKVALRKLGMKPETLTAQDVVNLAFGAARLELAGTYHGTAAQFRNFRHKYMGSGEGATAFGWGTYLAQHAGIGKGYWKADVARKSGPRQKPLTRPANLTGYERAYYDRIATQFGNNTVDKWDRYITQVAPKELSPDELAVAKALDTKVRTANDFTFDGPEGSLMRVDTAVEDSRMFDYDKSLDDQHPEVRGKLMAALEPLADEIVDRTNLEVGELTGKDLIGSSERNLGLLSKLIMGDALAPAGYDAQFDAAVSRGEFHAAASHYLRTLGLDGVKFLDALSRKAAPKLLVVNGKEYTRDDLVDSARNDPEGLGQYAATLRTALRSGVDAAKDELRAKVDDTYRMLANIEVESAERYGVPVDAKAIRERATAEALDTYHGRQLAWLEGQEVRVKETPVTRTRNLVIFDDKNIFRAGTAVGADRQRMRFGKATPAERAAQAMQTVEELGNALPPDPTVVQSIKAMFKSTVQNPQEIFQSAATARDSIFQKFGRGFWSTDFTAQHEIRKHVIRANMTAPQVTDMLLRSTTAQAQHSDAMGIRVAMDGAAKYDPATYTWRSVKSKANVETLSAAFAKIAAKYNRTEQDVERMWHSATEARRLNDALRTNALLDAEAAQFEADGDTQKAQAALDRQIRSHRTPEQIAKGMALFDTIPELNDANDVWDTLRGNIIDVLVEGGLYSQQEAETMFDNVAYVPFTRDAQLEEGKGPKEYLSGMLARRTPKFTGTDNPENTVHDIFDNIVRFVQYSVETSVRNRKALDLASATTELGITAEVKALTRDRPGVTIYREGKPVYVVENVPGVLEAFRGVEGVAIPALRWFSAPADWLRKSVVLFPLFPVLQVPQDSFAAMFSSGLKPQFALTIPVRAVKEFIKTLAGTSKIHEELKRTGVVGRKDVSAAVRRNDIEIAAHLKKSPGLWAPVSKVLHHISMASDNAVRQAVYEAAIVQGLSRAEALNKSFETINFRYRGTSKLMAMGAQLIPFFNAYQAATYVTYKTITGTNISKATREEARNTLRNTALVVMTLSMLYAMLLGGDEDYEDMADIKRNRLLVIPGTGTGIPLRPDLSLLPKVTGEHAYRMLTEMGTSDAAKFREAITESIKNTFLSPTVVPQVVKPWAEVMANYDPFTKRPLVGTYEKQQLLASMQTNDRTSELAKALAAASGDDNFSPIAVEHIIRGMFGSVGGVVLYASNQMMTPASGAPRAELSLRDALATFPGLGSVVGKDIEGGAAADFYQLREVTRKAKTTLDRVEDRMPQLLDKYLDNPRFMARVELADEVEYISQRLAKLREYKIAVQSATDMTPQEKQRELREIAESQQEWLKSAPMREWRARAQMR